MKLILVLIGLLFSVSAESQTVKDTFFNEQRLQFRVKQLDEFVKRFNYETDILGKPINNRANINERKLYILSLTNEELTEKKLSESELKNFNAFLDSITQPAQYLNFTDNDWYAVADCKVNYQGKKQALKLVLKSEKNSKGYLRWVIVSAYSDFLSLIPSNMDDQLYISPVENEINFMALSKISKEHKNDIVNYAPAGHQTHFADLFFLLVKNGQLEIDYVEKITYHFLQVRGWLFTVNHFERNSNNVGWLISGFKPATTKEKTEYKKQVLYFSD